ncbi:MAG: hypothetical protein ACRCV5_17745 [Afipia sp.]
MIRPDTWEADLRRDMPAHVQQWVIDRQQKPSMTDEQHAQAVLQTFLAWYHLGCLGTTGPDDVLLIFQDFATGVMPVAVINEVTDTIETDWSSTWPAKPDGFPAPLFE